MLFNLSIYSRGGDSLSSELFALMLCILLWEVKPILGFLHPHKDKEGGTPSSQRKALKARKRGKCWAYPHVTSCGMAMSNDATLHNHKAVIEGGTAKFGSKRDKAFTFKTLTKLFRTQCMQLCGLLPVPPPSLWRRENLFYFCGTHLMSHYSSFSYPAGPMWWMNAGPGFQPDNRGSERHGGGKLGSRRSDSVQQQHI